MWLFISIIGLISLILLFIQTQFVKDIIRDRVVAIVNDQLEAKLEIGQIGGNYFTHLSIYKGALKFGDTTIVGFDEISVSYKLWDLLDERVEIPSIQLIKPYARVEIDSSGVLNFSRIAKPSTPKPPKPVDSNATALAGFKIRLGEFVIRDGEFEIVSSQFHGQIVQFNLGMKASVSEKKQSIEMDRLSFKILKTS